MAESLALALSLAAVIAAARSLVSACLAGRSERCAATIADVPPPDDADADLFAPHSATTVRSTAPRNHT